MKGKHILTKVNKVTDITDTNETASWNNTKIKKKNPPANFHDKPLETAILSSRKCNAIIYWWIRDPCNSTNKSFLYNIQGLEIRELTPDFSRDLARQTLLIPMFSLRVIQTMSA